MERVEDFCWAVRESSGFPGRTGVKALLKTMRGLFPLGGTMAPLFSLFFAAILSCLVPVMVRAADKPVLVEVTGEAAGSDLEAPREVFERAKEDAERKAIEQAVGTFIRSHTIVSNGELAEDLIYARVRGKIEQVDVLSRERDRDDPNTYRVRIRAMVKPVHPDKQESIQIKAALTRPELREGDDVDIRYGVSADSYVYIFVIGADNSVTQLLPSAGMSGNRVKANQAYSFPPAASGITLRAMLLPAFRRSGAEEKVKIIATRNAELLLTGGFQEGFKVHGARETGLMSDLLRRLSQLDPADWGEATLPYRIAPASPRQGE